LKVVFSQDLQTGHRTRQPNAAALNRPQTRVAPSMPGNFAMVSSIHRLTAEGFSENALRIWTWWQAVIIFLFFNILSCVFNVFC
jgi:hypothetical protein